MALNVTHTQADNGCVILKDMAAIVICTYSNRYDTVILKAANVTHTPADMALFSLRIWLRMPHILKIHLLKQIWLYYH